MEGPLQVNFLFSKTVWGVFEGMLSLDLESVKPEKGDL